MKKYIYLLTATIIAFSSCDDKKDSPVEDDKPTEAKMKVLEYLPAPGQFINEGFDCQTMEEACAYAEERLAKEAFVSLGAFGGSITVSVEGGIKNRAGYDFGIKGNPFTNSSEPGIVWVSVDTNGNGKADDTWYELKGSDEPIRGYSVTYFRPNEPGNVRWEDNMDGEGTIDHLPAFHKQMYYPNWVKENSYTLTGSKLTSRTVQTGGIWQNQDFDEGYADNMGSDMAVNEYGGYMYNQFDLDDAIDEEGNPVTLEKADFIKVQSAILQNAGIIGEVSTEVVSFRIFAD